MSSPENQNALTSIEIIDILKAMQNDDLCREANEIIRQGGKAGRQESHKQALVSLHESFEKAFLEAVGLTLNLHPAQMKKIRYKKDRMRILAQYGVDYANLEGTETAQVLSQIAQAITREDAIVTKDLHNAFPFWKEGWPMVQFDNVYKILADDIKIHYEAALLALLAVVKD